MKKLLWSTLLCFLILSVGYSDFHYVTVYSPHPGAIKTPESSGINISYLIKDFPSNYTLEDARKNNHVIFFNNIIENKNRLDKFIRNYKVGLKDKLVLISFNQREEPIIYLLSSDGIGIHTIMDFSRDSYEQPQILDQYFDNIEIQTTKDTVSYQLVSQNQTFTLLTTPIKSYY